MSQEDPRKEKIRNAVVSYPDFPSPGICFRDCFPILRDLNVWRDLQDIFLEEVKLNCPDIDIVAGLEARGFLFGPTLALALNKPFVPIRKPAKLPGQLVRMSYELEYGKDSFEMQVSGIKQDQKVLLVDDLIATGGSLQASCHLIEALGGEVLLCLVIIELTELNGREKVPAPVHSVVKF